MGVALALDCPLLLGRCLRPVVDLKADDDFEGDFFFITVPGAHSPTACAQQRAVGSHRSASCSLAGPRARCHASNQCAATYSLAPGKPVAKPYKITFQESIQ